MRLIRRLEQRWERPVTLVVAGPGFGKTTVLAQAVRAHLLAPRGIDVWVSCEAPLEVCLLLAMALPATAHLVLSGREVPELPLARHEAAGELIRIGSEDLAFTGVEVSALAHPGAAGVRGWSLRAVAVRQGGDPQPVTRPAATGPGRAGALGTATAGEVAAVTGGPVALDDLVRRIPLVGELDDGRYRAHDLWTDALSRTMTERETRTLRERAATTLAARGDLARAGQLAYQARDWRLLAELVVDLVQTTLSALPRTIAERWLGLVPPPVADEPAFVLLRAAVTHARDFTDPGIDPMLDQAWHGMLDLDNEAGAAATLGQAVTAAHSRADLARLAELAGRADLLDAPSSPVLTLVRHTVAAVHAEVRGDPEAALAHTVQAPVLEVPRALALSTWRFHYHCLNMCGRSGEAADLADRTLGDAEYGDQWVESLSVVQRRSQIGPDIANSGIM